MFSFQGASESHSGTLSSSPKETQWSFLSPRNFSQSLWWRLAGSNRWPPACKAGALPAELNPHLFLLKWWAKMDSNHRPHDYQSCALASWAIGPYLVTSSCFASFSLYPLNWITKSFYPLCTDLRTLQKKSHLSWSLLRKEVIQPHLPIRLPCYDFTPITGPTFGRALLAVRPVSYTHLRAHETR